MTSETEMPKEIWAYTTEDDKQNLWQVPNVLSNGTEVVVGGSVKYTRAEKKPQASVDVGWNNDFKCLPSERVKELMANTAYPNSRGVKQAIEQALNELYHLNRHLTTPVQPEPIEGLEEALWRMNGQDMDGDKFDKSILQAAKQYLALSKGNDDD